MNCSFLIPMRQSPSSPPCPVYHTQWYILSGLDDHVPVLLPSALSISARSARAIQRAFREHLSRKRAAAMLAFAMAHLPGASSPASVLGADILPMINKWLV